MFVYINSEYSRLFNKHVVQITNLHFLPMKLLFTLFKMLKPIPFENYHNNETDRHVIQTKVK